jgi:AraC family transcriptional regulator, regulatory protein of adaptative response / DNA-3-methyladenine glycosylase II
VSECVQQARPDSVIISLMTNFSAVVTTGIYCRPGCGARPLPGNVRPFWLAAAAEAVGYRACLRCRPYRTDPPTSWAGPEVVCRAVQLILDGALDGKTEHDLAARLFVSARHLRRLFHDHLGVTPDQLARSSRTHFARRLLDDTDLTMLDIAFASGFGSVRQLNRACREVFRAAPGELRARRRAGDRLVADGGLALRLPFQPPLDWEAMLAYFEARAIAGVESVWGGTYRRTIALDGDPGVLELLPGGPDHLVLRAHLPHWEGLIHVVKRARRVFNLDADLDASTTHLGADPLLGPLVLARPGIRVPGTWDPFETGVRAIVGQQVSVAAAGTITARIVERHGTPVPGLQALGLTHLFPGPSALATAELGGLGLTSTRGAAIKAFARAVADDTIRLDRGSKLDKLIGLVTTIPGLGPWTAHYLALRLGEPDAFPATDLGLRRSLSRIVGQPMTPRAAEGVAERWRPWRAHAAVHLWQGGIGR